MRYAMVSDAFLTEFHRFVARGRFPSPKHGEYLDCHNMFTTGTGAFDEMPKIRIARKDKPMFRMAKARREMRWLLAQDASIGEVAELLDKLKAHGATVTDVAELLDLIHSHEENDDGEFNGAQGRGRPQYSTPESNYVRGDKADQADYRDALKFLEDKLSPKEIARVRELLEGGEEREAAGEDDDFEEEWAGARHEGRHRGVHGLRSRISGIAGGQMAGDHAMDSYAARSFALRFPNAMRIRFA